VVVDAIEARRIIVNRRLREDREAREDIAREARETKETKETKETREEVNWPSSVRRM
jgi:hypothetical protein